MYLLFDYVPRCGEEDPVFKLLQGDLPLEMFEKELLLHSFPEDVLISRETVVLDPGMEHHQVH